jgi:hypothetical protein
MSSKRKKEQESEEYNNTVDQSNSKNSKTKMGHIYINLINAGREQGRALFPIYLLSPSSRNFSQSNKRV